MKIFKVEFDCMYPVGCGLVIAANDRAEALKIARETIMHDYPHSIEEVDLSKPTVIFYQSGEY